MVVVQSSEPVEGGIGFDRLNQRGEVTLDYNLPKLPANLPQAAQDELRKLEELEDDALWRVADSQYDASKQLEYRELLRKNARGLLNDDERKQMNVHLASVDRLTLQKGYAYALLKWRGHSLPTLSEIEHLISESAGGHTPVVRLKIDKWS